MAVHKSFEVFSPHFLAPSKSGYITVAFWELVAVTDPVIFYYGSSIFLRTATFSFGRSLEIWLQLFWYDFLCVSFFILTLFFFAFSLSHFLISILVASFTTNFLRSTSSSTWCCRSKHTHTVTYTFWKNQMVETCLSSSTLQCLAFILRVRESVCVWESFFCLSFHWVGSLAPYALDKRLRFSSQQPQQQLEIYLKDKRDCENCESKPCQPPNIASVALWWFSFLLFLPFFLFTYFQIIFVYVRILKWMTTERFKRWMSVCVCVCERERAREERDMGDSENTTTSQMQSEGNHGNKSVASNGKANIGAVTERHRAKKGQDTDKPTNNRFWMGKKALFSR